MREILQMCAGARALFCLCAEDLLRIRHPFQTGLVTSNKYPNDAKKSYLALVKVKRNIYWTIPRFLPFTSYPRFRPDRYFVHALRFDIGLTTLLGHENNDVCNRKKNAEKRKQ